MTDLLDVAQRIVGWARDGEQVEAFVVRSREVEIRVDGGDVEQLSSAEALGAGIRVIADHRQGFAYAGSLDEDGLAEVLDEARDNLTFGTPDEAFGLAEPDGVSPADIDTYREALATAPTDAKIALVVDLEQRIKSGDPRIRAARYVDYGDSISEVAVATTTGIAIERRGGSCSVSAMSIAGEGDGTQTGFGFSVGRTLDDIDLEAAARDAIERAVRMLGARKPSTRRLTVLLDPIITAQFLGVAGSMLSGEAVLKGRSPFADRVGEEIASPIVTLVDDPTVAAAFSAATHDGEGLATRRNVLIDAGVLSGFNHNAYTARRMGTASTGSASRGFKTVPGVGCRALQLTLGTKTQAEMIAGIEEGLLVQDVSGLHSGVNPVSGDFSAGAEGLVIRNGQLAEPVREITIASTIQRMLQDVVEVGKDVDWLPMNAHGVSVAIADVTMSGS